MAKILPDRDIRKLIGTVLIGAEEERLNPNGIELRLGGHVLFHFTGEEIELGNGDFLGINPGETVAISSLERLDFRKETVQQFFPNCMIMGIITPTTTMMREGISQVSTKIDAGFFGTLNWGLRNGSIKDLILQFGEPMFKLTLLLLDEEESPEVSYGGRKTDFYQGTDGIKRSVRRLPADIPKSKLKCSSYDKLDPKKQLREAGYPFDFIGTELTNLQGKFEVVSKDIIAIRDQFDRKAAELGGKIMEETSQISSKLDEARKSILEQTESLFDKKFRGVVGVIAGLVPIGYGGLLFLEGRKLDSHSIAFICTLTGIGILILTYLLVKGRKS